MKAIEVTNIDEEPYKDEGKWDGPYSSDVPIYYCQKAEAETEDGNKVVINAYILYDYINRVKGNDVIITRPTNLVGYEPIGKEVRDWIDKLKEETEVVDG